MRLALAAAVGLALVALASCGDGGSPDAAGHDDHKRGARSG